MKTLRTLLLVIFSLLFAAVLLSVIQATGPDKYAGLPVLWLFAAIIVVLGPLWPSKEKLEKAKHDLPTDNPKLAAPLFKAALAFMCFYFAWSEWSYSPHAHSVRVKIIYSLFGSTGVIGFWLLLGLFVLVGVYHDYRKYKTS